MSTKDTRREIEELRALVDQISAAPKKPRESEPASKKLTGSKAGKTSVSNSKDKEALFANTGSCLPTSDPTYPGRSLTVASWAIIFAVSLALLIVGRDFLIPLAVAALLRTLLNSLVALFRRIRLGGSPVPKWFAWTCSVLILVLGNALVYWILVSQPEALYTAAPVYKANFAKLTGKFTALVGIETMPSTAQLMESLDLGSLLSWLGGSVGTILNEFMLVAIYVAFLLAEQRVFPEKIARLVTDEAKSVKANILLSQISKQVQIYVGIKTAVSLMTGIVSYIALRLVGVDFAAVWALIIFLLNYIPAVGSALGVILPALLTLVQFETLTPFILVVVCLGVTQFAIGNVVEPAMMGSSLNLSPFVIIVSLTFWGMIWGVAGMVLCVPITVIAAIVCSHFKHLQWIAVVLSVEGKIYTNQSES